MKLIGECMLGIKKFNNSLLFWHCAFEAKHETVIDEAVNLIVNFYRYADIAPKTTLDNGIDFGRPSTAHDCMCCHNLCSFQHSGMQQYGT